MEEGCACLYFFICDRNFVDDQVVGVKAVRKLVKLPEIAH